jgi:hypothetical protein
MILTFLFLIGLIVAVGGGLYQRHRLRTPFYPKVIKGGDTITIQIRRRPFANWPSGAQRDIKPGQDAGGFYYRHSGWHSGYGLNSYNWTYKKIKVSDPDADEKMIEAVVTLKGILSKWNDERDEAGKLAKQAQKALKR